MTLTTFGGARDQRSLEPHQARLHANGDARTCFHRGHGRYSPQDAADEYQGGPISVFHLRLRHQTVIGPWRGSLNAREDCRDLLGRTEFLFDLAGFLQFERGQCAAGEEDKGECGGDGSQWLGLQ